MKKEGEASFITWIKKRINHNLNFLSILEGPTGSGKSWTGLSIAYQIDPVFDVKEQIAFDFKSMMRIINKFNNKENPLHKKKYKIVLFDEAQTNLSNRDWQSRINKLFLYLLSTFRHQNIIVLFTSPYSDFLDSASMKLLHAKFELKGWNKKTRHAHIRPKILQYNSKMKKFYEHSLHVIRNRMVNKMQDWLVIAPPEHLIIPYEEMKTEFTNQLNAKITAELENLDKPKEIKMEGPTYIKPEIILKPLTTFQQQIHDCLKTGITKQKDIALKLNRTAGIVCENIKHMRKKGIYIGKSGELDQFAYRRQNGTDLINLDRVGDEK